MTQSTQINPESDLDKTPRDLEIKELEDRIETIEGLDDSSLGSFTTLDWVIVVVGSVVIPGFLLWWFA